MVVNPSQDSEITQIPEALLELVFREISRQEEIDSDNSEKRLKWKSSYSKSNLEGNLYRPFLDEKVRKWSGAKWKINRSRLWGGKHPFALCLTHDVDFISRRSVSLDFILEILKRFKRSKNGEIYPWIKLLLRNMAKCLAGPGLRVGRRDEYHYFDQCIQLEAKYGFKSTFFFFAETLPNPHILDCGYSYSDRLWFMGKCCTVREMIGQMEKRGCEIGLHGSILSAWDYDAIHREKQCLERNLTKPIKSVRQHYLSYDSKITPSLQSRAGLKLDSTHGFTQNVGFRAGTSFPYMLWDYKTQSATNIIEVPLHIMDTALLDETKLGCDVKSGIRLIEALMDQVEKVSGCLTVNWHPCWLFRKPYWECYEYLLSNARRRNAWGCTPTQLADVMKYRQGYG